ncbi:hypothetical protein GCM10020216_070620 [Nonomuraea helvata]
MADLSTALVAWDETSVGKVFADPKACFGVSGAPWKPTAATDSAASATAGKGCKLSSPDTRLTRIAATTADVHPERAHDKYRRIRRHTPTHNEGHPRGVPDVAPPHPAGTRALTRAARSSYQTGKA